MIIAPHPDDEVSGCGGTIAKHVREGNEVYLCIVTKPYPPEWSEEEIDERRKEVFAASKILGIKQLHFLELPTVKLDTIPQKELNDKVAQVIEKVKPQVLYIPHQGDLNKDHQIVFQSVMVAIRPRSDSTLKKVLSYETLSETEWAAPGITNAFIPNIYVDISQTLGSKLKAMQEYRRELKRFPHPRSLQAISNLAKLRGSTIGVKAAEAFMLVRELWA